jgi:hypothetical protein
VADLATIKLFVIGQSNSMGRFRPWAVS